MWLEVKRRFHHVDAWYWVTTHFRAIVDSHDHLCFFFPRFFLTHIFIDCKTDLFYQYCRHHINPLPPLQQHYINNNKIITTVPPMTISVITILTLFIFTLFMSTLGLHVNQGSVLCHINLLLLQKLGISRDFSVLLYTYPRDHYKNEHVSF